MSTDKQYAERLAKQQLRVVGFLDELCRELDKLKLRIENYRDELVNEGIETLHYPRKSRAAMLRTSLDVTTSLARLRKSRGSLWE